MAAADNIMFSRSSGAGSYHTMSSTLKFLVSSSKEIEKGGYYNGGDTGLKDTVNFLRVQELFFVRMAVCFGSEGDDVVSLTGPDPESVERAMCYIMAMCCPQTHSDIPCDAKLISLLFGKQDCPLRDTLERNYYVFLRQLHSPSSSSSFDSHSCQTTNTLAHVQGREEDVSVVVSKIQSMMNNGQSYPIVPPHPPMAPASQTDMGSMSLSKPSTSDCSGSSSFSGRLENAKLLEVLENLSMEDRQDLIRSCHGKTSGSSPVELCTSSQTNHVPNLQKRIDYFVQLDFSQGKVQSIIESLGPAASDNEIMNRLMKGAPAVHPINKASGAYHYRGNVVGDSGGHDVSEQQQSVQQQNVSVDPSNLRPIVIDGSNVAMKHGNGQVFSCRGIEIVVDYFKDRGHDKITVFVPEWRKESSCVESPITDQHVLEKLEREKHLVYTPSRKLNNGRRIICYDDRYIVRLAHKEGGVIVSNDQFRDLMQDNPGWKKVIEQRLLQFAFAADFFMPPDDPLGKVGPTLDQFLNKDSRDLEGGLNNNLPEGQRSSKQVCPHLRNCTFGKKCRYYHPDRESQPAPPLQVDQLLNKDSRDLEGGLNNNLPEGQRSSKQVCPHLRNCTFGKKCRYYHPDRESQPAPPLQHQHPQQLTYQQKPDQKVGSGLSVGHRTPTSSSRSPTLSPIPDAHALGNAMYPMGKSDPRGHFPNQGSSDGPHHGRSFSGRAMGARAGSDMVAPTSSSIRYSELGETSPHQGVPSVRLSDGLEQKMLGQQPTGWAESSPIPSDGADPRMEQPRHPRNHTFPLTQLPHQELRRENVTGDHSYLINKGGPLVGQGTPFISSNHLTHLSHQQQHLRPQRSQIHERRMVDGANNTLLPRETRQSQYRMQSSSDSPQYHASTPHHHHVPHIPISPHHPQGSYDFPTDPSGLRRDHYQVSPSSQISSPSPMISYGRGAGNIYPSSHHGNVTLSSRPGYSTSHVSASVNHTLPLPNMHHHHLSQSQPPQPLHTAHCHLQPGYIQPPVPTSLAHVVQVHPQGCRSEVEYSASRKALYWAAMAVLPGCGSRVKYVLDRHVELGSERDVGILLDLVLQMD